MRTCEAHKQKPVQLIGLTNLCDGQSVYHVKPIKFQATLFKTQITRPYKGKSQVT